MKSCPNIYTKEWKTLMQHLEGNETEAYRAYIAHGYNIPHVVSLTEFKKTIGLTSGRYSVNQQIKINQRVRAYNKKYGTAHFIKYSPYGTGELSIAEVNFNYLPVNTVNQEDRDRRRKMIGYGYLTEDYIPPLFFPITEKKKLGPKFQAIITSKEADRSILYQDRAKLHLMDKKASTIEKKQGISAKLAKVNKRIETIEDELADLITLDRLDQIKDYAEADMATLEKIFSKEKPTSQDITIARRLIHIWQEAGNFEGDHPHIFYDPDEFKSASTVLKEITDQFVKWREKANSYNLALIDLEERNVEKIIKETIKGVGTINFNDPLPDMSTFWSNVLDISEVDNVMFQATHKLVKKANYLAHTEIEAIDKKLKELIDNTGLRNFNIFQQQFSNTDTRKTGELVHRWTQEYFDWEKGIHAARRNAKRNMKKNMAGFVKANVAFINALADNTTVFDARIFFHDPNLTHSVAPTAERIAAKEKELRKLLGDKGFEDYYNLAEKQVEDYKLKREAQKSFYDSESENQEMADELFSAWEVSNSPYYYADLIEKGYENVTYNGKHSYPTLNFVRPIPKADKFYDNKFKEIESSDSYLELYNYMFDLLQEMKLYLPNQKINFMQMNSIPFLRKKVGELFGDGEYRNAASGIKNNIIESTRVENLSQVSTDEDKKELQIQMVHNNQTRINQYINLKTIEYKSQNDGNNPNMDTIEDWRRDIIDEISQEKSFDLDRVLKAFAATAITYKHKSMIEDSLVMIQEVINRSLERKENAAGEPVTDKFGNQLASKGLENLRKMMDDFMDVVYWGYPSNKPEGKTNKKVLTDDEKDAMTALEESKTELEQLLSEKKISNDEYYTRLEVVQDQIDTIGGVKTWSKYGDLLLQYIQLKGMGWNIWAAFANFGFGFITNVVESSDGRNYSAKNFWKAQAMTLNSVTDGLTPNGRKIRELMHHFDTLKESKNELFESSSTRLFKKIGDKIDWANPYAPQSRTEYLNQAPVMIALMMQEMITVTVDGKEKEMSMWDVYNTDGTLIEGVELSDDLLVNFKVRLDKLVKMNHGNYDPDSHIRLKSHFFGRAISQFRTWAFQGFAERFKGEMTDYQLKNQLTGEDFIIRKGRYLSFGKYWAYMQEENGFMGMGAVFNGTYQLLRKLVGLNTTFDKMVGDTFTEVDAANMRKNMTEIALYAVITAFVLMLKAGADDEDDPKKRFAYFFLINNLGRLGTDVMFYANPIEFERLFRNAIPAFTVVVDTAKVIQDAWNVINGGEDILQSGTYKGQSRTWRDFKKLIPGPVQIQKLQSAGGQVYKKTTTTRQQ